jgi:N-methylhydantoinase A/oxoprolinase/acetone carboxylase beta subunit
MTSFAGYEIGVDIGGTFTDVVCRAETGEVRLVKIPTTRGDPSRGVALALEHMRREWAVAPTAIRRFVHGTTVATNAVLERKGARIGLITTEGFKDVLEIGRQMRHSMYDLRLRPETPVFLAPGRRRLEVRERIASTGEVVTPLDEAGVRTAADALAADGVEGIAIAFLFSFLNPAHERRAAEIVAAAHPRLMISLSSEVDPAFREYERTCVTAFDAYIKPIVARYLAAMEKDLAAAGVPAPLQIMQSRGGISASRLARGRPVRLFLSGPAAGVIGGMKAGAAVGATDLITVDIGGTSCDIALVRGGKPLIRSEGVIDGYAVRVPMVDVNAIGAGGGSIAWLDAAGSPRVGPHSAGSEPGPACYGRGGTEATVTDASVVLGYVNPDYFAAGSLRLDPALARRAIEERIAEKMGLSVEAAALGIHRVVNAQMAEAIRLVSIGRGIDPRGYALLPLGGGGPLHAIALARDLAMTRIVVPPHPGVLSAAGLLGAPIEHEVATAYPRDLAAADWAAIRGALAELDRACGALMAEEGMAAGSATIAHHADVCYIGQSYHIEIPFQSDAPDPLAALYRDFLAAHDRVYGHSTEGPARLVNLRTIHQAWVGPPSPVSEARPRPCGEARKPDRAILIASGPVTARVWDRAFLAAGATLDGPAIVEQADTTTLIEPGWRGVVAPDFSFVITQE